MHESVPKAACYTLNSNIEKNPSGRHQVHDAQSVVERITASANTKSLADTTRNKVAQYAKSCCVDTFDDLRQTRPHNCLAITRSAVKFFVRSGLHNAFFHEVMNRAFCNMTVAPVLVFIRATSLWGLYELTSMFKTTVTKRCIHRDDFSLPHVTYNTSLRDCVAFNRHDDINVHHFARTGVTEVLSCGPDDVSTRRTFHC